MAAGADRLLKVGAAGTLITALCCFTPVLFLLLGAVGLATLGAHLDYVLLPALALFTGVTVYALWRRRQSARCAVEGSTCAK